MPDGPAPERRQHSGWFLAIGVLMASLAAFLVLITLMSGNFVLEGPHRDMDTISFPIGYLISFTIDYPFLLPLFNITDYGVPAWEYHWAVNRICAETYPRYWDEETGVFCFPTSTYGPVGSLNITKLFVDPNNMIDVFDNITTYVFNVFSNANNSGAITDIPSAPLFVAFLLGAISSVAAAVMVLMLAISQTECTRGGFSARTRMRAREAEWVIVGVMFWAVVFYMVGAAYAATKVSDIMQFMRQSDVQPLVLNLTWGRGFEGLAWGAIVAQFIASMSLAWHAGITDFLIWRFSQCWRARQRSRARRRAATQAPQAAQTTQATPPAQVATTPTELSLPR